MGKSLARRANRPAPLLTKELRKRSKFSNWQMYKIHAPIANLVAAVLAAPGLITWEVLTTSEFSDIAFIPILIGDGLIITWNAIWFGMGAEKNTSVLSSQARADQIQWDELRAARTHRDDEMSRLKDLDHQYPRYSLQVSRNGTDIVLKALQHTYKGWWWPFISWHAATTKKLYDSMTGTWRGANIASWTVTNPSVEAVMDKIGDGQLAVEQLENQAYAQALEAHRLDVLAIAVQPPPASSNGLASAMMHEDELQNILNAGEE